MITTHIVFIWKKRYYIQYTCTRCDEDLDIFFYYKFGIALNN